jgi:two-component system chemotaxis response regulator CheB
VIRALIVDDSAVMRQHIKHVLEADSEIQVIGMSENGLDAVNFVQENKPDIVTMDINMPKMNGHEATRRIMETTPVPIVIVTASYEKNDVEKSFLAMEAGALAIVEKPFGLGHAGYDSTAKDLVDTVKIMSEVKVIRRWPTKRLRQITETPENGLPKIDVSRSLGLIAIGASTGGPPVLQTILAGLGKKLPVPVVVVQHISKGFIDGLIDWLKLSTGLDIHAASHNERLQPGQVYFAPDDCHMGVRSDGRIQLSKEPPENGLRPSVSYLFRSALTAYSANVVAVLLTGMGKDGAEELKLLKDIGAVTIAQDRESSVIYGMPGEAVRLGAVSYVLTPEKISQALVSLSAQANRSADA